MRKYIARLHYLTQDLEGYTHIDQAKAALSGGCNWLQYRCLNKSFEARLEEAAHIAELCDEWGATFMICQDLELCAALPDVQGLHIEDELNYSFAQARERLGEDKTIGISAIGIPAILAAQNAGADYISTGPFAHTDTKPNTHAHLGMKGLAELMTALKAEHFDTPLILAGGIQITDIQKIFEHGVQGIALAAAVNKAEHPKKAFEAIYMLVS